MNNQRAVIIQARMSSRRLPGKTLMCIGERPLVFYVIRRLQLSGLPVIVATSSDPSDDELARYLEKEKFTFYRGDLENVLHRYINTAEEFGVEEIIRITADNPLVDIEALQKALPLFKDFSYVDGIGKDGLLKGTGFELVKLSALRSIVPEKQEHREHVTLALREKISAESTFITLPVETPSNLQNEIFLTCDHAEDLELLRNIFEEFNFAIHISIEQVIGFYKRNPELFKLNQFLHRTNIM